MSVKQRSGQAVDQGLADLRTRRLRPHGEVGRRRRSRFGAKTRKRRG